MGVASIALELERRVYGRLRAVAERRQASRAARAGESLPPVHLLTGERGEDAAFFYLRELGYTVVARRWRAERLRGDLDLVAWDDDTLVIFEIKTRTARDRSPAEAEVDRDKQRILRRMAGAYLRQLPEPYRAAVPVRFDVLSVYLLPDSAPDATSPGQIGGRREPGRAEFEHFRDAFTLAEPIAGR